MAAKKRSTSNGAPRGFKEVDNTLRGFWKPEEIGQSLQGVVGHEIETKGAEGKPNIFYAIRITDPAKSGPVIDAKGDEVEAEAGDLVGAGGAILLTFLSGREGQEVYLEYNGLGPKKGRKNAAKLYKTYAREYNEETGEVIE